MTSDVQRGKVIGKAAKDFSLKDHEGNEVKLSDLTKTSPVMLVFYPGDFTYVCTAQLCDYRNNMDDFNEFGIQVVGISQNDKDSHQRFVKERNLPFLLLTDPDNLVAKQYGCKSIFMLGMVSRAVFLINKAGTILYRYVEPTVITRRKSSVLLDVAKQLRANGLI